MNVHEHQAHEVLKRFGIPVPNFGIASSVEEAEEVVNRLNLDKAVVKVQVHAGGRGKAGGVKLAQTRDEILEYAKQLIGMKIVTKQTGPEGVVANKVMIAPLTDIQKEYYVGAIVDRDRALPTLIISPEGGMDIEEIAEKMPERIMTQPIALDGSVKPFQLRNMAKFMGWQGDTAKQGMKVLAGLAKAFMETDASLLEINPLITTPSGDVMAIDAKLGVDDNALYRQKDLEALFDPTQTDPNEAEAKKFDLAYVALDGEIGCMVNGAGLAMSTMDIISHHGGSPANFLDVGGSADEEVVGAGFRIILTDPKVKAILVNIFGGIMNCGTLAQGIVNVAGKMDVNVPLVVRMEGTNVKEGKRILAESSLNIITADSLTEAADKVVAAAKS